MVDPLDTLILHTGTDRWEELGYSVDPETRYITVLGGLEVIGKLRPNGKPDARFTAYGKFSIANGFFRGNKFSEVIEEMKKSPEFLDLYNQKLQALRDNPGDRDLLLSIQWDLVRAYRKYKVAYEFYKLNDVRVEDVDCVKDFVDSEIESWMTETIADSLDRLQAVYVEEMARLKAEKAEKKRKSDEVFATGSLGISNAATLRGSEYALLLSFGQYVNEQRDLIVRLTHLLDGCNTDTSCPLYLMDKYREKKNEIYPLYTLNSRAVESYPSGELRDAATYWQQIYSEQIRSLLHVIMNLYCHRPHYGGFNFDFTCGNLFFCFALPFYKKFSPGLTLPKQEKQKRKKMTFSDVGSVPRKIVADPIRLKRRDTSSDVITGDMLDDLVNHFKKG